MLVNEVIRPSVSTWSLPIVLVTKRDGSTRFCIDFQKVNSDIRMCILCQELRKHSLPFVDQSISRP